MHEKRGKKTRYAKNPVFDNKVHNEIATYSKSAVLNLFGTFPTLEETVDLFPTTINFI